MGTKICAALILLLVFCPFAKSNDSIERHENFIAPGREDDVKVQVSLKHQFIHTVPLYYGYTIQGFWAAGEKSYPFRDIDHNPELFYRFDFGEVGYEHMSNGLDNRPNEEGERNLSRSLERAYVIPSVEVFPDLFFAPKLSTPVFYHAHSPVHEYLGNIDLTLNYRTPNATAGIAARKASRGGRVMASGSFNPGIWFGPRYAKMNNTYLYFEAFQGYAETLLDYDKKTSNLRVGMRFILR